MEFYFIIAIIDFIINYFIFSYQRGTLLISRIMEPKGDMKSWATIQAILSPTWLGTIAILNYATLILALFLLLQEKYWYSLFYIFIRFIVIGIIPTFDNEWAKIIVNKYKNKKRILSDSDGIVAGIVFDEMIQDGLKRVEKKLQ